MPEPLLKVKNVSKRYCRDLRSSLLHGIEDIGRECLAMAPRKGLRKNEFWANKDISFELRRGECLGLIGSNGAGKSTLLKLIAGLTKPDEGSIEINGRIGALIELGAGFNPLLTGLENIYVNGAVLGMGKKEVDRKLDSILEFADIAEFIDAPVQSYSSGMKVRLGFAVAVHMEPDILILDEILAVGDTAFQAKCFNALADLREAGTPFILVSHNMHTIERYCNKVAYLKKGALVYLGERNTGIEHYTSAFETPESKVDWAKINGSGRVVLTNAQFTTSANQVVKTADHTKPICLRIDYQSTGNPPTDPILDIAVRANGQQIYQSTNKTQHIPFGALGESGSFIVRFDSLPINAKQLHFYIALFDAETNELFDWKREITLKMAYSQSQHGLLAASSHWEHQRS